MKDRLQKKCVVGSALGHGLLCVVILFGSAFSKNIKEQPSDSITIVDPHAFITDNPSKGGNPAPAVPQPQPQPQPPVQPPPQPPPVKIPDPPRVVVKPQPEPVEKPKIDLPEVADNTTTVETVKPKKPKDKPKAKQIVAKLDETVDLGKERREREKIQRQKEREAQEAAAKEFRDTLNKTRSEISGIGTSVATKVAMTGTGPAVVDITGPGGGGPASARYRDAVFTAYYRAWIPPEEMIQNASDVEARVVVNRDGSIISAKITKRSGKESLDHSVERALRRVDKLPEFPKESSDSERSFLIKFDLDARNSIG